MKLSSIMLYLFIHFFTVHWCITADNTNMIHIMVRFSLFIHAEDPLLERAYTTSEADLRALISLSKMVFPLPGSQAKCRPLLTLMLSPHCAKCYLWCHICPGKWSKTAAPCVCIGPTELAATIPRHCLPAYFYPSNTHSDTRARKVDTTHHTEDCQHEVVWFCSHKNNSLCG